MSVAVPNFDSVLSQDKFKLKAQLRRIERISDQEKKAAALESLQKSIDRSIHLRQHKLENKPTIVYPQHLPVSQKHDEIKKLISENQVVIIAGATGSGKTTQIPKMCLELGLGIEGKIGHTQPRRLAARTVANRLSEELNCELGDAVGYKVRFTDQVSDHSYIKLMTDGVLLAEIQHDRYLNQYDTIIIDEAHERSLNIDFILGLLKDLLNKRKDLKVIITSATIDPERFSKHFFDAPIISVSGRTYPVEVRYRPLEDMESEFEVAERFRDSDQINGIINAVKELDREAPGDILVFLSGEREIRDTADALIQLKLRHTEILPLYARLSSSEQNRIFAPHSKRHIVLATNVAETSLTVPGIKYVIDPGTARISRYSYKTKVQRLPIEPISQASADQRKGRCGRTQDGICIRLYSEEDFLSRSEFTAPEILRTNLASVILQMLALKLGDIERFPFIQKPDSRFINDGMRLLEEIGAVSSANNQTKSKRHKNDLRLTALGQQISRIPLDPRLATMVVNAIKTNALHEVVIIATALSIQDPRERPADFKQKSDELHARFKDKESDFNSYLNLWDYILTIQDSGSRSQLRKTCRTEFLNYLRIREWQDLVYQIETTLKDIADIAKSSMSRSKTQELDDDFLDEPTLERDFDSIHKPILSGLLSHIGQKQQNEDKQKKPSGAYVGARNSLFHIFPGSNLFKNKPKWVMSAELVETSKLYARNNARILPEWLEELASHLVKKTYAEPYWDIKNGAVYAYETVSLYGLVIVGRRKVNFSKIDPEVSHHLFIQHALVQGEWGNSRPPKQIVANNALIEEIKTLENKIRRREILKDEAELVAFYQEKIPLEVNNKASFTTWLKKQNEQTLLANYEDFSISSERKQLIEFPDTWRQNGLVLPLEYDFEPGTENADGVSVRIPVSLLNQVENVGFDWLIEPYQYELFVALIKSMPKQLRRNFVPAPNYADALLQRFRDKNVSNETPLIEALSEALFRMTGVKVAPDNWQPGSLPAHLKMNFRIVDEHGEIIQQGHDLEELKSRLQGKIKSSLKSVVTDKIEETNVQDWSFGELPVEYVKKQAGFEVKAFPALTITNGQINVELLDNKIEASQKHIEGVIALLIKTLPSPIKHLQKNLPNKSKLVLYFNPFGKIESLIEDCVKATIKAMVEENVPRNEAEFFHLQQTVSKDLNDLVLETTLKVEKALAIGHQISKQLKGKVSFDMIQANAYLKSHLDSLIYKGFVSDFSANRLEDLIRYVKALEVRAEKIKVDINKDRQHQITLDKLNESFKDAKSKFKNNAIMPEELAEIRWMIEELRVSLFAQTLGTKYPISEKRVKQALATLNEKRKH